MLDLLLREAKQSPQDGMIAKHLRIRMADGSRDDVLLDEAEQIEVGMSVNLIQGEPLGVAQARDLRDVSQRIRQEGAAEIESGLWSEHALDRPSNLLRGMDDWIPTGFVHDCRLSGVVQRPRRHRPFVCST